MNNLGLLSDSGTHNIVLIQNTCEFIEYMELIIYHKDRAAGCGDLRVSENVLNHIWL